MFTLNQVKQIIKTCKSCLYLQQNLQNQKAIDESNFTFQHLNSYFKGPLLNSTKRNRCLFIIINKFSRFPICICLQRQLFRFQPFLECPTWFIANKLLISYLKKQLNIYTRESHDITVDIIQSIHDRWELKIGRWFYLMYSIQKSLVHNKHHLHGGSIIMDWFIYNNGKKKAMASRPCKLLFPKYLKVDLLPFLKDIPFFPPFLPSHIGGRLLRTLYK